MKSIQPYIFILILFEQISSAHKI